MKRIIYIIAMLLPLVTGCSKQSAAPDAPEEYGRYIFFSQGVETKAPLIESAGDLAGNTFGVVGFKYDNTSSWDDVKAAATPNVFYDDDGQPVDDVETLTCETDGTATYSPLQGWSNTKKYAFFAYYPLGNNQVTLVAPNGDAYTGGIPAIKYTMDTGNLQGSMVDVMTATALTDLHWYSSTDHHQSVTAGDVKLTFDHCLSSLGINIKNSSAGDIKINSVKVTVSGLIHTGAIIALDGSETKYETGTVERTEFTLDLPTDGETIAKGSSEGKEIADKLIFIPQTDNITIDNITIGYQRLAHDGYAGYEATVSLPYEEGTVIKTVLTKGKKHIIHLNFTDSTVDIKPVTTGAWKDEEPVTDTFN